ncbi:MAG: preprotein translocase subunit SecE [Capsulimonadaceae bacterium]|nr:preprotein translocase subunit SecE [Capsulimonadaceae bacterium]
MPEIKKEDPRVAKARQRAERLAKSGPGSNPAAVGTFFNETIIELKKTHWPERQVLQKSVYVVLVFILAVAIWEGFLDSALQLVGQHIFSANSF